MCCKGCGKLSILRNREPACGGVWAEYAEGTGVDVLPKATVCVSVGTAEKERRAWKAPVKNCDAIVKEKQNNQYSQDNQKLYLHHLTNRKNLLK